MLLNCIVLNLWYRIVLNYRIKLCWNTFCNFQYINKVKPFQSIKQKNLFACSIWRSTKCWQYKISFSFQKEIIFVILILGLILISFVWYIPIYLYSSLSVDEHKIRKLWSFLFSFCPIQNISYCFEIVMPNVCCHTKYIFFM